MSSYEYHEFLAVDRALTQQEISELRRISSRAEITPTRFANEYSWGSLKADPFALLARYFDVYVYVPSWGSRRLALRVPAAALSDGELAPYAGEDGLRVKRVGESVVLDMGYEMDEPEAWVEPGGWMAGLAGVREELLRGDRRLLYLAWLLRVQADDLALDDEDDEPPVPAGLGQLSPSLTELVDFFDLDADLLAAAAEASTEHRAVPQEHQLERWLASLDPAAKDTLLRRAAQGESRAASASYAEFVRAECRLAQAAAQSPQRTILELRERAEEISAARRREQARRETEERRRAQERAAALRERQLDAMAGREVELWGRAETLIEKKSASGYAAAIRLLVDLRDLAARAGEDGEFQLRLEGVRSRHGRKGSFISRLRKAGLG